jgi:alkylmercury lyase
MLQIPMQEIITAHTDTLSNHYEEFVLLIRLLRLLGEETSVSPEHLVTATHHTRAEVEAFLQSTDLVVCRDGTIDLSPDPHLMQLEKKTLIVACALDTLVYPVLLGRWAHVLSTCPATGRQIRLTVTPERIEDLDPANAVISLRMPGPETNVCNVRETVCHYGHFFVDREHASTWPGLHPEVVLLSIEEGAQLAHEIASAACTYMDKVEF